MAIVYVQFEISMRGLNLTSEEEMEELRLRVKELISEYHPSGYSNIMDSDVEVEITEHAGMPNGGGKRA